MSVKVIRYSYDQGYPVEQYRSVPARINSSSVAPVRLGPPVPREAPTQMTFGIEIQLPSTEQVGDASRVLDCHPAFAFVADLAST